MQNNTEIFYLSKFKLILNINLIIKITFLKQIEFFLNLNEIDLKN